jgi:hypothetical protein
MPTFHPLPEEVFPESARFYIKRLNKELVDLFALEGVLRNPLQTSRSDASITRRNEPQVDVSRIVPSVTSVVSGASTVVGTPALTLSTTNVKGTTTTAIATNSTIALFGTSLPLGSSTSGIVGTSALAPRSDHRHPHSDTLMVAGTSKLVTLSDGGAANGALFQASGTTSSPWSGNGFMSFAAPGGSGTASLIIDSYGFLGVAGSAPAGEATGNGVMNFNYTMVTAPASTFSGIVAAISVAGSSATSGTQLFGAQIESAYNSTIGNSKEQIGINAKARILQAACSGDATALRAQPQVSGATTRTNVTGVKTLPISAINGTITSLRGFQYSHINAAATILNTVGFDCDAITRGTSCAIGFRSAGHTVGSTACFGFEAALHTAGTLRRSFVGDNSLECRQQNMIVGTSGMGFVVKDTTDGNYYLIKTAGGVVGSSSLGTTLPAI